MSREIGSDFHWCGLPPGPFLNWPDPLAWFGQARTAVTVLWDQLVKVNIGCRVWLPRYFCPHTIEYWRQYGLNLSWYHDAPNRAAPDWATLTPRDGDLVIAVNYFGVRTGTIWQDWQQAHPSVLLLEDHTHDPLSTWAKHSQADYAIASIRKIFPVSDGAIIWSPQNHPLPTAPPSANWSASALRLAAMLWKMEYIAAAEQQRDLKHFFRQLQLQSVEYEDNQPSVAITPWSQRQLSDGYPQTWRHQREANVRYMIANLPAAEQIRPLFSDWSSGHCPFNIVLVANTEACRDSLRRVLIEHNIYPAIHWQINHQTFHDVWALSRKILTLPVDQRYQKSDLDRIIEVVDTFLARQVG